MLVLSLIALACFARAEDTSEASMNQCCVDALRAGGLSEGSDAYCEDACTHEVSRDHIFSFMTCPAKSLDVWLTCSASTTGETEVSTCCKNDEDVKPHCQFLCEAPFDGVVDKLYGMNMEEVFDCFGAFENIVTCHGGAVLPDYEYDYDDGYDEGSGGGEGDGGEDDVVGSGDGKEPEPEF